MCPLITWVTLPTQLPNMDIVMLDVLEVVFTPSMLNVVCDLHNYAELDA